MATTTVSVKTCSICGKDVSAERRTKDASGKYYCQTCYASAAVRAPALRPSPAPAASSASSDAAAVPAPTGFAPGSKLPGPAPRSAVPETNDTTVLKAGEYDAFLDPAVLGLLRNQVEPEALLGVCDVLPPGGSGMQTVLLTATKLVFVTLRTQAGQSEVAAGRQVTLADLERVNLTSSHPSARGRERFNLQLATRDRIENWTSEFSALQRIASAVRDLKAGEPVRPFIRTTDDLAAMRARTPQGVRTPHPGLATAMYWLDHLVVPPLRSTRSITALWAVWVVTIIVMLVAGLVGVVVVLILFDAVVAGKIGDVPGLLLTLLVTSLAFLPVAPNALCCSKRLKAIRAGDFTPAWPIPHAGSGPPRPAVPWPRVLQVGVPVAVGFGVLLWWFGSSPSSPSRTSPGGQYQPVDDAPLPEVTVAGNDVGLVSFSDWKLNRTRLTGTVRYSGDAGVELHYRVTENGVLKDSGVITPPTGGSMIMSREPMSVSIMLPSRPTSDTQVEIQALGG